MTTLMTAVTALAALVFLAVVAWGLTRIIAEFNSIGGTGTSYLAKLRFGLRAINSETAHLPAAVPGVNKGLQDTAAGLMAVDATLGELHAALMRQEEG